MVKVGHQLQTILAPIDLDKPVILRMMMIVRILKQEMEPIHVMIHLCDEQLTQDTSSAFVQIVFAVLGTEFMAHTVVEDVNIGTVLDHLRRLSMGPLVTIVLNMD